MATRPELVLDRFITLGRDRGLDLATAEPVLLRAVSPGGASARHDRVEAAGRVAALRIPGMATLVDYGMNGRDQWVEAYGLGRPADQAAGTQARCSTTGTITALLMRAGCEVRTLKRSGEPVAASSGLFIPALIDRVAVAGAPHPATLPAVTAAGPALGTVIERRDELEPVMEWMTGAAEPGARILRIGAPAGAGLHTFFDAIAREARLAGFVPVASRLCGGAFVWPSGLDGAALWRALRNRHVVILDDSDEDAPSPEGAGIALLLSRLDTVGGRPNAVVCARRSVSGKPSISLRPLRPDQLRRSVLYSGLDDGQVARAISGAIRKSGGWPAAFSLLVTLHLGLHPDEQPYQSSRARAALVREAAPQSGEAAPIAPGTGAWTSAMLVRSRELAERGRHAAAERLLRRAVGYLRRRRRVGEEATWQLALGRLLLSRGRRMDACEAFEASRRLSDEAKDAAGVVQALLHLGSAHIDDGALPSAESVLRTARVGATRAALHDLGRAAHLLLARCLFWQGKHDESWQLVEELDRPSTGVTFEPASSVAERGEAAGGGRAWGGASPDPTAPPGLSVVAAEIGVRTALARKDVGLAARRLAAAREERADQDPVREGALIALHMLVQGSLGDANGIIGTAAAGLNLIRRRHAPLVAQEIRLAELEALIEAGARVQAAARFRRLAERASPSVAGLARSRLEALAVRLQHLDDEGAHEVGAGDGTIDTAAVLRILQHCHEAQSEADAVGGVCQTVKTAVGAGAVSAFAIVEGAARLVATAGHRACRPELAERSAVSLLVIGPERSATGCELAVPVRYGGGAIGALAARWPPGTADGEARAQGIMSAAAAAVGPAMAALCFAVPVKADREAGLADLGGPSAAMAELRREVSRAAAAPYPVLILGESGTGKELIAKAIHAGSARRVRRFCAVNCAALSDELFETELFGHARGSFTGASSDRSGLFEDADGGTLFLDEVGELSPRAQAKLLRAIQEGEIRRVGENHPRRVDTRVVAATNRLLSDDVRAGRFRHDLLYRLDVVRIVVPPLRDRPEDIGPLALGFWREAMRRTGGQAELSPATLAALARYDWPGNVRELQNTLAALAVHAPPRGRVGPSRLPPAIAGSAAQQGGEAITLAEARRRFEERFVRATLARSGGHRAEAASTLGLSRQGLAKLIARLGISREGRGTQAMPH